MKALFFFLCITIATSSFGENLKNCEGSAEVIRLALKRLKTVEGMSFQKFANDKEAISLATKIYKKKFVQKALAANYETAQDIIVRSAELMPKEENDAKELSPKTLKTVEQFLEDSVDRHVLECVKAGDK